MKTLLSLCMVFLFAVVPGSFAQGSSPPSKAQEVKPVAYPVALGDQTLFYVRDIKDSSGRQFSGEARAKTISDRIKTAADNPEIKAGKITIIQFDQPQTLILAGSELLISVVDQDVFEKGQTRDQLAAEYSRKIDNGIKKYREDRSLKRRLTAIIYSLISTFVLIALLVLLNKLYRRREAKIQAWLDAKKVHIGIQSFEVVRAERLKTVFTGALKVIRAFIALVIFYIYLHLGLSFFPETKPFADHLFDYVLEPLTSIGGAVLAHLPKLLFIAIIAFITYYVLKLMRLFFSGIEKGTLTFKGFYPEWAQPTYKICRLLAVAFAAIVAFPYIPGSDTPAFKGVSIFIGILFSLGSSSAIANMVAGFTLTYRRAFKVGDRVKIADFVGDVVRTRLQVTHLRTIKNEEITVPNSMIVGSHVINYSSLSGEKGLILHTKVTIGYDAPWRQVHAMLLMAAERTHGLLRQPPPFVLQTSLDDFYVSYELNVYTDNPLEMAHLYSELHQNIQDVFNEYGVQIMSPAYESDPDTQKFVPKERWYAAPAKSSDPPKTEK